MLSKMSVTDKNQLRLSKDEMEQTIHALQTELENLRRIKSGQLRRPQNEQRDAMIEENTRMQLEIGDQLWALKRVIRELSDQLGEPMEYNEQTIKENMSLQPTEGESVELIASSTTKTTFDSGVGSSSKVQASSESLPDKSAPVPRVAASAKDVTRQSSTPSTNAKVS
jgi:regulator of replication initiation timing